MSSWLPIPEDVLLSLRKQTVTDERSQWVLTVSGGRVTVHYALFGEDSWSALDGSYTDLEDSIRRIPELGHGPQGLDQ